MDSTSTVNILSYNSTGMDTAKIAWINELAANLQIDLMGVQEHFKCTKSVEEYFRKHFPQFYSHVKPAVRDTATVGRPRGGLTQFVNKKCNFKKEIILCKSWRLQAEVIHIGTYKLLWVNAYMPNDPQTALFDESETLETLQEIENIFSTAKFHDMILAGDLNMDSSRQTKYVKILSEFFMKHDLLSVWTKFPADFTYQHNTLTSFSTIDHFMVTEQFLQNCVSAAPVHRGDNRSNHSPILLQINVPAIVEKIQTKQTFVSRANWRKADDEDLDDFYETAHMRLSDIRVPESINCQDVLCKDVNHSHDRDLFVIEILESLTETSLECIPLTKQKPVKVQQLPGWNETVLPLRNEALFWHAIWISAGRPRASHWPGTSGGNGLHNVMKWSRNKYHYAVKAAKREADRLRSEALGAAAEAGNKELFKEMKHHLFRKGGGQDCPDSLEGKVTHEDILEKFRECYSALFNRADRSNEMEVVKCEIEDIIRNNIQSSVFKVSKITPEVVRLAVERMKPQKSDVSCEYTSDMFIHGPDIMYEQLAAVFRSWVTHGTITREILCTAFMPLLKSSLKDPSKFNNYRAIAGASQLLKMFEYVVLILWGHLVESDSLQCGYKRKSSCTMASWLVLEVGQWFYQRGGAVHAAFCDMTKAFDYVLYDKLFEKLLATGMPAIVVKVIVYAYQEQKGWVRVTSKNSEPFSLSNGVKQGGVLSPFWFSLYLDPLLKKLRKSGIGCNIAGIWVGAVCFADDLALLAPDRSSLQRMLDICAEYGAEHNLVFSTDPNPALSKTKCVLFRGKRRIETPANIKLNGEDLPWVPEYLHLGHKLHESLSMEADSRRAKASFMSRADDLRTELYWCHPRQRMLSIHLYCTDNYGTMNWDLQSQYADSYFKSFNIQARRAFDIDYASHVYLIEGYLCHDLPTLRHQVLSRYGGFVRKLLQCHSREISFVASMVINDQRSVTCKNLTYLNELTQMNVLYEANWKVMAALPRQYVPDSELWRINLLSTLMDIKIKKTYSMYNMDKVRTDDLLASLCKS